APATLRRTRERLQDALEVVSVLRRVARTNLAVVDVDVAEEAVAKQRRDRRNHVQLAVDGTTAIPPGIRWNGCQKRIVSRRVAAGGGREGGHGWFEELR